MSAEYRHVEPTENFAKPQIPFVLLPYCIHSKETSFVFVIKNAFQHLLLLLIGYKKAITIANSINRATTLSHLTSIFHYQCSEKEKSEFPFESVTQTQKGHFDPNEPCSAPMLCGKVDAGTFYTEKKVTCSLWLSQALLNFFFSYLDLLFSCQTYFFLSLLPSVFKTWKIFTFVHPDLSVPT